MQSKTKILIDCAVAIIADLLQMVLFPFFIEGAVSPFDDALDFGVGAIMIALLGWNWAFLPTAMAKLLPVVDVAPFWTAAVFYVVWKKGKIAEVTTPSDKTLPAPPGARS
jgi:hypothetical protein